MRKLDSQNTNLAAEFFVVSQLYRRGFLPLVTLGHTKQIDIVVENPENGKIATVDVKGLTRNGGNWLINPKREKPEHFFVLVYFDRFSDTESMPKVFVVPSMKMENMLKGRSLRYVTLSQVNEESKNQDAWKPSESKNHDAWKLLDEFLKTA
jgi:hypothetical protein